MNADTMNLLAEKHPRLRPKNENLLLKGPVNYVHEIVFDEITPELVKKCAAATKGACGPSGVDADEWRRILDSNIYGDTGSDLRRAVAQMVKQLCMIEMEKVNQCATLEVLMSCRLIPLDKCPGLRPIGIGEVLRRIMGKCVMAVLKKDVLEAAGNLQLCAGQKYGCEIAVHAMNDIFNSDDCEGVLQIDAKNAFNSLNRTVMIHNIKIICPTIATYDSNCYSRPARLFVLGGAEILSEEGTTQGDPIAMAVYALGITSLMSTINSSFLYTSHSSDSSNTTKQVTYADDLIGAVKLKELRQW
ncbi:uncharacterized protein LOC130622497 [Hydractinia symbiolongicarpus]|uniref:uncharacterized protein LOC130622497 n=1 Tax=Hydractinia symbiolongicarpus TaxID=13093 RepID=UPI00254F30B9|nr:uncharacterized protein LOC130622497 [Hydractinia symbiolongicarpus]XP_057293938.1 uncharacterized protein LOC130622497 [Hydractinia symbiolongicarpus]